MARTICVHIKNFTFPDGNFHSLEDIIDKRVVYSLEMHSKTNDIVVRDSTTNHTDTYEKCDIYQLHDNFRGSVNGYDISTLEVSGTSGTTLYIEYHL